MTHQLVQVCYLGAFRKSFCRRDSETQWVFLLESMRHYLGMPEEDSRRGVVEPRWVADPRATAPSAGRRFDIAGAAAALSLGLAGDRLGMRE